MMLGMGDTTPAPTPPTTLTFGTGLNMWTSPSAALTAVGTVVSNPSTSFAAANLPFSIGLLSPLIGLGVTLLMYSGGKR